MWANPKLWLKRNGNAYIDTLDIPSNEDNYEIIASLPESNIADGALWGSRSSNWSRTQAVVWFNNNSGAARVTIRFSDGVYESAKGLAYGEKAIIKFGKNGVEINGENLKSVQPPKLDTNLNALLFGLYNNVAVDSRLFNGTVNVYKKSDGDGNLIKHLVPVPAGLKIGDYTVPANGMWDMVNQKYYGNAGSGEFEIEKD